MHKPEKFPVWYFRYTTLEYHTVQSAVGNGYKLTRALQGYLAERAPLVGGGADSAPLPNSRTGSRSETGEAAIESS